MTKDELVFVSSPKSKRVLSVWNVREFNSLPNVVEMMEDYDVATLQDILDKADLCDDFEFYNTCIEHLMSRCITKQIDSKYIVEGLENGELIECKTYEEALLVYNKINWGKVV
jgi:hypothetical protein